MQWSAAPLWVHHDRGIIKAGITRHCTGHPVHTEIEQEKSYIRETPTISTDAESSTDTFFPLFFIRRLQIMDKFSLRRQSSDGSQEHIFHCRLWTSSAFSSRRPSGDTGYGAGYGPLQRSHWGDHQEISGYGAGIKDTELWWTNERPVFDHVMWGPIRGLKKWCKTFIWTWGLTDQFVLEGPSWWKVVQGFLLSSDYFMPYRRTITRPKVIHNCVLTKVGTL